MTIIALIRLVIAAGCILLLDQLGFWVWLVAHPFWNFKGAVIGIAVGCGILFVSWLALRNRPCGRLTIVSLSVLAIVISAGIAFYGKNGFAESFGEDRVVGMFWFYGYLALTTSTFIGFFGISQFIFKPKI